MNAFHRCDVSQDKEFQKTYNGFYRMRQRKQEFYQIYFEYMEKHKYSPVSFDDVITYLYNFTSRYEPSFSSKLLATINPDMPVWDKIVLSQLSIKPPPYNSKNRLKEIINIYSVIEDWYIHYLETKNSKDVIYIFDKTFPDTQITNIKKIDLALWSMGEKQ